MQPCRSFVHQLGNATVKIADNSLPIDQGKQSLPVRLRCGVCLVLIFASCFCSLSGCSLVSRRFAGPAQDGSEVVMPNPTLIQVNDVEFTWNQIVDMVDDYFDIASEQQVREVGGILMPGRIVTRPRTGATCTEFLMRDSTPGYERAHATLQSIRRSAQIGVTPSPGGFLVSIEVYKELEDVSQPEYSTVTSSVQRHDGTLVTSDLTDRRLGPATLGWILLGRDQSLEQAMLRNLHARMFEVQEALIP